MKTDNQPLQAKANAYRAKMFRAINARKYHVKLARKFLRDESYHNEKYRIHLEAVLKFHKLANYNRSKSIELGRIVLQNMEERIAIKASD